MSAALHNISRGIWRVCITVEYRKLEHGKLMLIYKNRKFGQLTYKFQIQQQQQPKIYRRYWVCSIRVTRYLNDTRCGKMAKNKWLPREKFDDIAK